MTRPTREPAPVGRTQRAAGRQRSLVRLVMACVCVIETVIAPVPVAAQDQVVGAPGRAGEPNDSPSEAASPSSLRRIRAALRRPPGRLRESLAKKPTFQVEIREHVPLEALIGGSTVKSGPPVPGGWYAYEQQRAISGASGVPLPQPFGMDLLGIGRALSGAISSSRRARATSDAQEEVRRAIAEYCAQQPDSGAGIPLCAGGRE